MAIPLALLMGLIKKVATYFYPLRMRLSRITGIGIKVNTNNKMKTPPVSFYSLTAKSIKGDTVSFEKYRGKKVLIVNLASKCGFTPQYAELEEFHRNNDAGFTILGFPSDDFGGQEPGNDEEIAEFCQVNFGVTFELFHKDHVNDEPVQPVYQWLTDPAKNGWNSEKPGWNFYKYIVDEEGHLNKILSSSVSPLSREIQL